MNKLQSNRLNDGITKLQSSDHKMILLNLISQEHNKYIHYKIEKDKFLRLTMTKEPFFRSLF